MRIMRKMKRLLAVLLSCFLGVSLCMTSMPVLATEPDEEMTENNEQVRQDLTEETENEAEEALSEKDSEEEKIEEPDTSDDSIILNEDILKDSQIAIDENNFPDEKFREYVLNNIDINKDTILSLDEIEAVRLIGVKDYDDGPYECFDALNGVADLTGIEYFTNLEKLSVMSEQLSVFDLSENKKLTVLYIKNYQGDSLCFGEISSLENLTLSNCKISFLDISGNSNLFFLGLESCENLTSVNTYNNAELWQIDCWDTPLTSIDLSCNAKLHYLLFRNVEFKYLDVSQCPVILERLENSTVYQNEYLIEYSDNERIIMLDPDIELITESSFVDIDEKNFPDYTFREFIKNNPKDGGYDKNHDGKLSFVERTQVTSVDFRRILIGGCWYPSGTISDLTGIEHFSKAQTIYCNDYGLSSLDVSKNAELRYLNCSSNNLKNLSLSSGVTYLDCHDNELETLDLSEVSNLGIISCEGNKLKNLDISHSENIYFLDCSGNELSKLDISNNPRLIAAFKNGEKTVEEGVVTYHVVTDANYYVTLTLDEGVEVVTENEAKDDVIVIFNDIDSSAWYVGAIQFAYDNGIMSGKGSSFGPRDPLKREQFAQTLYNMSGKPAIDADSENPFADITNKSGYPRDAVLWAYQNKITSGKTINGVTKYCVGQNITREEMARMLYVYAKLKNYDLSKTVGASEGYADTEWISNWAKEAMDWAISQGIMSGKASDKNAPKNQIRLDPKGNATRAECASMIMKLLEKNQQ